MTFQVVNFSIIYYTIILLKIIDMLLIFFPRDSLQKFISLERKANLQCSWNVGINLVF